MCVLHWIHPNIHTLHTALLPLTSGLLTNGCRSIIPYLEEGDVAPDPYEAFFYFEKLVVDFITFAEKSSI